MPILENIQNLIESPFFIQAATASVIVIVGVIAGHFFSKAVGLLIKKLNLTEKIKRRGIRKPEILIESAIKYIIYAIAVIAALNRLGIFQTILSFVLVLAGVIIVILLILSFRDLIANVTAGLILHSGRQFKVGKKIKVGDIEGKIRSMSMVEIKIITKKRDTVVFPNSFLLKSKIEFLK